MSRVQNEDIKGNKGSWVNLSTLSYIAMTFSNKITKCAALGVCLPLFYSRYLQGLTISYKVMYREGFFLMKDKQ